MRPWVRQFRRLSDEEFAAEIEAHLAHEADERIEQGLTPEAARCAALRAFGNVTRHLERFRERSPWFWLETLSQDLRYGWRSLRRAPVLTLVAIPSLALGIGLNAAVFSILQAVFMRPLPYADPDRLVSIAQTAPYYPRPMGVSAANYLDWQRQNHVFERMAVYEPTDLVLAGSPGVERVAALRVSADFFPVLGVPPVLGRVFDASDDQPGTTTAVVSDALWRRRWQADPHIVGRTVSISGAQYSVIGVMPPTFRFYHGPTYAVSGETYDVWLPYAFGTYAPTNRFFDTLGAIARLEPGISLQDAQSEMAVVGRRLGAQYPVENKGRGVWVTALADEVSQPSWDLLRLVWVVAGVVLLLACTNLAALLLARAVARTRELGLRACLGASRARIIRQVLTETALLTLAGGGIGLLFAVLTPRLVPYVLPEAEQIVRLGEARVDATVFLFTVALALSTTLLAGLAAAVTGSRLELRDVVSDGGRAGVGRRRTRLLKALVVGQLSLSLLLLSAAGLMIRSLWRLSERPLGFNPASLLTLETRLPPAPPYVRDLGIRRFPEHGAAHGRGLAVTNAGLIFPAQVLERLRAVPGVEVATAALGMPMLRTMSNPFYTDAQPVPAEVNSDQQDAWLNPVSPDYFRAFGTPLLEGRDFNGHDRPGSPWAAIVNRALAAKYWPASPSVIGKHLTVTLFTGPRPTRRTYEVVGVVGDVRAWPDTESHMAIYTALAQDVPPENAAGDILWRIDYWFALKVARRDAATIRAVENAIHRVNASAPVENVRFMDDVLGRAFARWRTFMWLLALMAAVALLLACIGVYGVTSYVVAQRTHEIGVRVALGANRMHILRPLLASGVLLAITGIVIGLVPALWLNRLLGSRLYGVTPGDPLTLAIVGMVLTGVTVMAVWWPARRAASADPLAALRCE